MATKKPKRKTSNPATSGTARLPSTAQPWISGAPLTPDQIRAQAGKTAQSQVQPELDDVRGDRNTLGSGHQARVDTLIGQGKYQQSQLNQAYKDAQTALNQLIATGVANNQAAQDTLAATLRRSQSGQEALAAKMGGAPLPSTNEADIMAAAALGRTGNNDALTSQAMAYQNQANARTGLAGVLTNQGVETERRRYAAGKKGLDEREAAAIARVPGLTTEAMNALYGTELEKSKYGESKKSRLFQQWLAKQELKLKGREADRADATLAHQTQVDATNANLQQQQINNDLLKIQQDANATNDTEKKEKLKAEAQNRANAIKDLETFYAPKEGEGNPGDEQPGVDKDGNPILVYRRHFNDAYRFLLGRPGISQRAALEILSRSQFASWRTEARRRMKYKNFPALPNL